jgi:tetratricopeptide (TPR) repeat protein
LTLTPFGISWIVAERYVYLGTLGILVLIAYAIQKIGELSQVRLGRNISSPILAIILLAFSFRTIIRNLDWKNQDTLLLATAKTSPSSAQNHNNLGDYYVRQGNLEKAIEEFKKAIELLPGYADAYHNLANTYLYMGKTDLAVENFQKALSVNPNLWQSHQSLTAIYYAQGKFPEALKEMEITIKLNPDNPDLYSDLGIIYLRINEKLKARTAFQQALQLDPNNEKAKQGLKEKENPLEILNDFMLFKAL